MKKLPVAMQFQYHRLSLTLEARIVNAGSSRFHQHLTLPILGVPMMNSVNRPKYNLANLEGRSSPERRAKLRKPKTRKVSQRLKKPPLFKPRERHYQMLEWLAAYRILTQR